MSKPDSSAYEPGALVGAIVGNTSAVWIFFSGLEHGHAHVLLLGVAVLCGTVVMAKRPSWQPILAFGLTLHALVLAAVLYVATQTQFDTKLAREICAFGFFSLDAQRESTLLAVFALPVLALSGAGAFALGRLLARRGGFLAPLLRLTSLAVFAGAFVLLCWAIPEISRKPTPDRYIESLPVFAVVPPAEGEPLQIIEDKGFLSGLSTPPAYRLNSSHTTQYYEHPLPGNLVAQRYCPSFRQACTFMINHADSASVSKAPGLTRPRLITVADYCEPRYYHVGKNDAIVLREDAAHGLFVLDGAIRYGMDRTTFTSKWLRIRDVIDSTSSPRGWMVTSAMGLFVAAILEMFRIRARRRIARIEKAPAGVLDADGWLALDNGSAPLHVGLDAGSSPGSVIVISMELQTTSQGGPYRGDMLPEKVELLPGERAEVLRRERWLSLSSIDALAIAVLLIAAMPLATFWQR